MAGAVIEGIAIPYNKPTWLGGFWEQFVPGTFAQQFADGFLATPAIGDAQHDDSLVNSSTVNGSLTLTDSPAGVRYRMELLEADARMAEAVASGLFPGASIVFSKDADEWDINPADGLARRTVTAACLYAVSIVATPAYRTTTARVVRTGSRPPATTADPDMDGDLDTMSAGRSRQVITPETHRLRALAALRLEEYDREQQEVAATRMAIRESEYRIYRSGVELERLRSGK